MLQIFRCVLQLPDRQANFVEVEFESAKDLKQLKAVVLQESSSFSR